MSPRGPGMVRVMVRASGLVKTEALSAPRSTLAISCPKRRLLAKGLAKGRFDLLKILGQGELKTALTVVADRFSKSAIEKIEAAGGTVQVVGAE